MLNRLDIKKWSKYGYLEIEGEPDDIWFTSDAHFFHKNIIELCNRPFSDVEEMTKTLMGNWNSVVKEHDIIFNLGDFIWSDSADVWRKMIDKLHGHQILILGNHDNRRTVEKLSQSYRLWDENEILKTKPQINIEESGKLVMIRERLELRHHGNRYMLDHFPQCEWNGSYHGVYHLFGHIHEKDFIYAKTSSYNVCVDRNDYRPISMREVNSLLDRQKETEFVNFKL